MDLDWAKAAAGSRATSRKIQRIDGESRKENQGKPAELPPIDALQRKHAETRLGSDLKRNEEPTQRIRQGNRRYGEELSRLEKRCADQQ